MDMKIIETAQLCFVIQNAIISASVQVFLKLLRFRQFVAEFFA